MSTKDALLAPELVADVAGQLNISLAQVESTLKLIVDDCTVPFIARYRKEATGGLDEVQIRDIRDTSEYVLALRERKDTILRSIQEQGKLTVALKTRIETCKVKTELEDLYLPFKPKKRTRGQIAKERGLEPLALRVLAQDGTLEDLGAEFISKVGSHDEITKVEDVIQGVKDFIAESISESVEVRQTLRHWIFNQASFHCEARPDYVDKKTKYSNYFHFSEPVRSIAPHRLMALRRGEKEEILKVTLEYDDATAIGIVEGIVLKPPAPGDANNHGPDQVKNYLKECVSESFKRIIGPSIETELRLETKSTAENEAINVFSQNLRNLLLLPPIPSKTVLGIDPGIRTGSKAVVVDATGKLLEWATLFPDFESRDLDLPKNANAATALSGLITRHKVECLSIGNGTAGREMEEFAEKTLSKFAHKNIRVFMVNESGASVYSASDVAREEFPDLDITYRGAVSIARRLQDPLSELVKIDPKSIGVGQYQHDVNQSKLKKSLEDVVESCVNYVGVRLNTASPSLLSYVAGIGPTLAKNIVRHRESRGGFKDRGSLFEVMGFGPKAFEQAAGFLRVPESPHPLDNTAVHPEAYLLVEKIAKDLAVPLGQLVGNKEVLGKINLPTYVTPEVGLPTLQDIMSELLKPGRDPREEGIKAVYSREVRDFDQLQEGQIVDGTVTNVTNFGAFVDIGVHQDGLVHISELATEFVRDAAKVVSVGEKVRVKVIGIDRERRRISLSRKGAQESQGATGTTAPSTGGNKTAERRPPEQFRNSRNGATSGQPFSTQGRQGQDHHQKPLQKKPYGAPQGSQASQGQRPQASAHGKGRSPQPEPATQHTVADLLSKFNRNRL